MISNEKNNNANFEKFLPFLMETIDDLIIIASSNNSFEIEQIFKCKFLEQLGYSNNKLIGKSMLSIFHFGDGITKKDFIQLIEQEINTMNIQIIKKNGNLIWTELIMKKFNDEKSQEKYILKLRNISELKELELKLEESEKNFKKIAKIVPEVRFWDLFPPKKFDKALHSSSEKLRQNEAKFHTAIESLPFGFFMINKDGYYVMQNTACKENWGNIIGKRLEDIANSKDTLAIWKENNSRAFAGEIVKTEVKLKIDDRIHYFYSIITPVYIDDKIEYILGVNIDTTDRKIADQKLKESEEKYRLIYENANDLIRVFNNNFEFEYLNENVHKRVLEYSIEELVNMDPILLFHPEDRKQAINRLSKILRKGEGSYEARFKHKDGHYKWLELSAKNFVDSKGNKKILSIGRDITDRKIIEQRIKESEQKYRDIAELLPDIIYEGDLNLNLTYVNSVAFKKFGYTPEDLESGLKMTDFLDSHYKEKAMIQIKSSLEGNLTKPEQYLMCKKDGSTFYARIHSRPILKDNKVVGIRGTITDISDIILAKQELKESEQKFRNIFESIPDMFFLLSEDTTILDYHGKKEELYIPPEEFMGKKMKDILPPEIGYLVKEYVEKTLITNKPQVLEYELPIRDEIHYFEARFLYFSEKTIAIFIRDITKRKIIEEKLKESEEKFRTIAEQSLMGICIIQDFEIKYLNLQMAEMYGYPLDEIKEWKTSEFIKVIHPDYRDMVIDQIKKKQQGSSRVSTHYIAKIIRKDGKTRWVENYSKSITYQGKTADFLTQIDITAKILAEQKVSASEEKYRHLYEKSPFAILLINMDGEIIDSNLTSELLSGFKRKELIGKNFANATFIPKEYIYSVVNDFKTLLKNGILEPRESQLFNKDRIPVWVSYQASIITIENETLIQVMIENISKRKKAEENLKESEAKYHKLFETSPDGVVLTDLNGTILETNSALESISGYSSKEFLGKNFMDLEIYHENALDVLLKGYEDLLNENRLEAVEFPIKTKNNTINWVQVRSTLINMKGKTCILTVIHDITTLKEAEEAIRKNEEKFRDILETSSVGVMEFDVINKKLLYINPKLLNMIGFNKEELTEEVLRHNIIHPKDLTKLLITNEEAELEFQVKNKQGKLRWLAGRRIPHYNENGETTSIRVWLDDITEKKMYENLIYELNINFLNFTTDIRNNIDLLLNTCLNLLDGDLILYIHKIISDDEENYKIISSDETYIYNSKDINQLFLSALFHEEHDFPQTFFDIDRMKYAKTDPFIIEHKFKGSFGKVIKSNEGFNSAVCIFYKNNPIISGEDKLVLFLICDALEIEQRRWQVQEDLEKQNITLNKINKLKSELFSRTSHELKTPLISVKGFTELLLTLYKSKLDPEIISILKEISDGSKRLEKIINLLLESTKLEAGQLFLNLQDENLTFLIKFCVKELQGLVKLRDQNISLNLQDFLETKFDKERIYEVISNLLVNAIKYTPPGGKIVIESKINEESYEISIKDNGIGFTEEEKNQVFRQFGKIERYGQGWDIAADGTGLGLYITKKLVELHGGKIWLESEGRNKGSTFHFSIPILK